MLGLKGAWEYVETIIIHISDKNKKIRKKMYLSVSALSQVLVVLPIHILIRSTLPYFSSLCGTVEMVTFKLPIRSRVVVVAGRVDASRARC